MAETTRAATHSGPAPHLAGAWLTVDLDALARNYRALCATAEGAAVAGVVKADAYGLGLDRVVPTLLAAGCRQFFVALPDEGAALRALAPEAEIFVLAGLFGAEAAAVYAEHRLVPVLNSQGDIGMWEAFGWEDGRRKPCAIHVDTGMNRLGLAAAEALSFAEENALTGAVTPVLVMSHLACADAPAHPLNRTQLDAFRAVRNAFKGVPASLANSGGTFLAPEFRFDLVRPGIALYGGAPGGSGANPMETVTTASARIVQLRYAGAGETVSYGATARLSGETLVAVAAAGYADGYHRAASGHGVPLRQAVAAGGHGFLNGVKVPVIGRVTMDLTMFDVTALGIGNVAVGDLIELFGPNLPIDAAAAAAGTIAYELLTALGRRYHRHYAGGGERAG